MKLIHILLIGTLLLCGSGIALADMSEMVDMDEVQENAMSFWADMSEVGYLILGAALAVCVAAIFGMLFLGSGKSALGKQSGDSNATNEGRGMVSDSLKAAAGLVIGILVLVVIFGFI